MVYNIFFFPGWNTNLNVVKFFMILPACSQLSFCLSHYQSPPLFINYTKPTQMCVCTQSTKDDGLYCLYFHLDMCMHIYYAIGRTKRRQYLGAATPRYLRRCFYHLHNGLSPHRRISIPFFALACKGKLTSVPAVPSLCRTFDTV